MAKITAQRIMRHLFLSAREEPARDRPRRAGSSGTAARQDERPRITVISLACVFDLLARILDLLSGVVADVLGLAPHVVTHLLRLFARLMGELSGLVARLVRNLLGLVADVVRDLFGLVADVVGDFLGLVHAGLECFLDLLIGIRHGLVSSVHSGL